MRRRKLPIALILAIGATVAALATWSAYTRMQSRDVAAADAHRSALRLAHAMAREQERMIEGARQLLLGVAQRSEIQTRTPGSCSELLAGILTAFPAYLDIVAVTPAGETFCSGRQPPASGVVLPADVQATASTGDMTLGTYAIDRATRKAMITLAAPAVDDMGSVQAVVVVALDLTTLARPLIETPLVDGAALAVVDGNGVILTHYPDPERWTGEVLDDELKPIALAAGDEARFARGLDGNPAMYVAAPLLRDAHRLGDARAVLTLPVRSLYAQADRRFQVHVIGVGVVALLLVVTAGLGRDLLVARPAQALTAVLRRLAAGDVRARTAVASTSGELRGIGESVNLLARTLESQRHAAAAPAADRKSVAVARAPVTAAAPAPPPPVAPAAPATFVERAPAVAAQAPKGDTHWGLRNAPFGNSPDPAFLYLSPIHEATLSRLTYAVRERRGCLLLTGPPGCGKTTLLRALIRDLEAERFEIALVANPVGNAVDLLREVLYELGVPTEERRHAELFHLIHDAVVKNFRGGRETVILVDDGQLIDDPLWYEDLGMLLNLQTNERSLLTIVLVGTPEVVGHVRAAPHLDHRIGLRCQLAPLDALHTGRYIAHRLAIAGGTRALFTERAVSEIFEVTHGTPREVNNVCDAAL
ncbi:MAG TPA: AAA family ATPase, partial [Candidatus Limnocylindria bacterium]|nr:AAA family ATPase [Candidatus Limnocylindria bacterium]